MTKLCQKYNNLLVHENIFRNVFSQNPKYLALSILIKAKYGSSVVYGNSYKNIANKLEINDKTLIECLKSKELFSIKKKTLKSGEEVIRIKANKIYARGKNITLDMSGEEYFDTRHMRIGIGKRITLKTITDKLYVVQAVLCAHQQGNSIYATYGAMDSRISSERANNREDESSDEDSDEDSMIWTGCSIETFSRKLKTSKYKTREVLKDAQRLKAITKRVRKIIYQGKPSGDQNAVSIREGGKFTIVYENGKVMEQLSNEYRTTHIRFKNFSPKMRNRTLKDGTVVKKEDLRKKKSGENGKFKNFRIPKKVKLEDEAIWRPEKGLSYPDIVNGSIVATNTCDNLPRYIRTDLPKEHIKSLKKSRKSELKAMAKEILQGYSNEEVMLPYKKDKNLKGKKSYIKMLEGIRRNASDYTFTKKPFHDKTYIDQSIEKYMVGTYHIYEVVSFIMEVKKMQKNINRQAKKLQKKGENCPFFIMNDWFISMMVRDMNKSGDMLDKVSAPSKGIFEEFIAKDKRSKDGHQKEVEISMEAIWKYLACSRELDKYIYEKRMDMEVNSNIVNIREYMMLESERRVDDVIGIYG